MIVLKPEPNIFVEHHVIDMLKKYSKISSDPITVALEIVREGNNFYIEDCFVLKQTVTYTYTELSIDLDEYKFIYDAELENGTEIKGFAEIKIDSLAVNTWYKYSIDKYVKHIKQKDYLIICKSNNKGDISFCFSYLDAGIIYDNIHYTPYLQNAASEQVLKKEIEGKVSKIVYSKVTSQYTPTSTVFAKKGRIKNELNQPSELVKNNLPIIDLVGLGDKNAE